MIEQGTVLDNTYRIVGTIGAGGGGEIYLADHLRLEKRVVIKKVKDEVRGMIESRGEADILKKLNNPYLPQVYDYFVENRQVYTVMEYIEGENFQQLLEKGVDFSAKDILRWGKQLSEVVAYLHEQKPPIIHRDIKPSNIMLTPQGNVCLIDFNVSMGQDGTKGVIAHTDGYSPPEQYGRKKCVAGEEDKPYQKKNQHIKKTEEEFTEFLSDRISGSVRDSVTEILGEQDVLEGKRERSDVTEVLGVPYTGNVSSTASEYSDSSVNVSSLEKNYEVLPMADERSDIYSLGATLYHIITHKRPEKATECVTPLCDYDVKVSDGLVHIIDKSMQPNPSKRYQTADKMRDAFANIKKLDREYLSYALQRDVLAGIIVLLACISAACVVLGYRKLKAEEYNAYVAQIEAAHELYLQGNMEEAGEACKAAVEMRPRDMDAYIELVNIYYMQQRYEEGISIVKQADMDREDTDEAARNQKSILKFLEGECYMGLEEFSLAAESYKQCIEYQPEEGNYYTRCAIALAHAKDKEGAEKYLEEALRRGISDAAVYLTKAEIRLSEQSYKEAEELVYQVLDMTEEDGLAYHAYLTGVRIYEDGIEEIDDAAEKKKALLESAMDRLDSSYALSLSEQLADVYYEFAGMEENEALSKQYYEKALMYFNTILDNGYRNIHVLQNIAIINQTLGNYEEAEKSFLNMIEMYPEDYRGYMYLTLLYSEIQDKLSVESRSYEVVFDNYEKADMLYQRYLSNGGSVNTKMQMLESMINDLKLLTN